MQGFQVHKVHFGERMQTRVSGEKNSVESFSAQQKSNTTQLKSGIVHWYNTNIIRLIAYGVGVWVGVLSVTCFNNINKKTNE